MDLSRHADARMQQCAIPSLIAGLLLDHGSRMRHKGAEILFVCVSAPPTDPSSASNIDPVVRPDFPFKPMGWTLRRGVNVESRCPIDPNAKCRAKSVR